MPRPPRRFRPRVRAAAPGTLYVLRSGRDPSVVKIGWTAGSAKRRMGQIAKTSGYRGFGPYTLIAEFPARDGPAAEAAAHRALRPHRIWLSRTRRQELFRVDALRAIEVVRHAAATVTRPLASPIPWNNRHRPRPWWRPRARLPGLMAVFATAVAAGLLAAALPGLLR